MPQQNIGLIYIGRFFKEMDSFRSGGIIYYVLRLRIVWGRESTKLFAERERVLDVCG